MSFLKKNLFRTLKLLVKINFSGVNTRSEMCLLAMKNIDLQILTKVRKLLDFKIMKLSGHSEIN